MSLSHRSIGEQRRDSSLIILRRVVESFHTKAFLAFKFPFEMKIKLLGWYLLLYLEKGKKITLQQYSWNNRSKEWEVQGQFDIPAKQLEGQLKAEVGDEKCFRLK